MFQMKVVDLKEIYILGHFWLDNWIARVSVSYIQEGLTLLLINLEMDAIVFTNKNK
jgi:hypothetical protein